MNETEQPNLKKARTEHRYALIQWIQKNEVRKIKEELESRGTEFYGNSPLFFAASENSPAVLELLESFGFSLDTRDSNQNSLHFYSCRDRGKTEVVEYLLQKKILPDPADVVEAANAGKIDILKLYQKQGIDLKDPNLKNSSYTLLEVAAFSGLECVKFLFDQGVKLEDTILPRAANLGKLDLVRYLLEEQGANPNVKIHERNAVHEACLGPFSHDPSDHLEILKLLHKHGGDLNAASDWIPNSYAYTPLHFACRPGPQDKTAIIKYLLENGANPDLENPNSALSIADTKTRKEILSFLETKKGIQLSKDPFERSFQVEKMIDFAENAIRGFAKENPNALVFQFVIEGATMSMSDLFDPEYYVGDWKYEGFASFEQEHGFDFQLWREHYDSMGEEENSPYSVAMTKLFEGLRKRKAFDCLKRSKNFEARMIDHMY
ncbi:ankyrin repeat domain-containing protein [Leptospira yasudae]|uniref:ankyrin repeat domain-containing protein n=1 Tax=Leptospira yasudae TaxID=2202201 RepID=UPI001C4ED18C|nr:ankyrin repeat domain-containing protein [Leptospira yasudae]MBW0432875.1 ankyrin repeat domain-containing protein [Leptospira yasudae]